MSEDSTPSAGEIQEEIERTRADLAQTVDALSEKLDVKAQAKAKAQNVAQDVTAKAQELSATAVETATKLKEQAPPQVQAALDRSAAAIGPAAQKAQPYRSQIAAGAGAFLLLLLVRRRRRRSR